MLDVGGWRCSFDFEVRWRLEVGGWRFRRTTLTRWCALLSWGGGLVGWTAAALGERARGTFGAANPIELARGLACNRRHLPPGTRRGWWMLDSSTPGRKRPRAATSRTHGSVAVESSHLRVRLLDYCSLHVCELSEIISREMHRFGRS